MAEWKIPKLDVGEYKLILRALEWLASEHDLTIEEILEILAENSHENLYQFDMCNLAPLGSHLLHEDSIFYRETFIEDFCQPWYGALVKMIERRKAE